MNRILWIFVVAGALFWASLVYRLAVQIPVTVSSVTKSSTITDAISLQDLLRIQEPPSKELRDPFLVPNQRPTTLARPQKLTTITEPTPPDITVDAILWGDNPVAILRSHGSTALLRTGQQAFGVKVQTIRQTEVVVVSAGRSHVLRK